MRSGTSPSMSRCLRSFSTSSRGFYRGYTSFTRQNGPVNVQHVRIVKPYLSGRRLQRGLGWFLFAGILYYKSGLSRQDEEESEKTKAEAIKEAVQHVKVAAEAEKLGGEGGGTEEVATDELRAVDKADDEEDDEDLVPEEQPDDAWFIPLGLAQQIPQTFYRGDDPEWQSFVKFAKDRERSEHVKKELAGIVGQQISGIKNFQKYLGNPITIGRTLIDFDFPDGPPPEYERYGLEVTEDYVALTHRPVDPVNISRLRNTLWPTATGLSLWASCSALYQLQMARVRKALDLQPPEDSPNKQRYPPGYSDLEQIFDTPDLDKQNASKPGSDGGQAGLADSVPSTASPRKPWQLRLLPELPQPHTDLNQAAATFKHSLVRNWKPAGAPPPRGTFLVTGLVEVRGSQATCLLDVAGAYDPTESQWVALNIGIRKVKKRQQKPKG